ncbi:MAG TPA: YraN family protein [Terriglobales bacterium]
MKGTLVHTAARALDKVSGAIGHKEKAAAHLITGQAGEDAAYFHLRKLGYVMVARNWRVPQCKGELDLVAWDGEVLCFVEVKTRTTRDVKPAEAAVDERKRRELAVMARNFMRRLRREKPPEYRFDVVSVYLSTAGPAEITLFKNAFVLP